MRIVIDLQGAQTESRFRGIGRYTLALAQAVIRNRGEHEIIIALNGLLNNTIEPIRTIFDQLLPRENIRIWHAAGPVCQCASDNIWRREAAECIREAFLASLRPDVVHVSSLFEGYLDDAVTSIGLFDQSIQTVVTLYDLIPLLNPDYYLYPNPTYESYYLTKINHLKKAAGWLGISKHAVSEGQTALELKEQFIFDISSACDSQFKKIVVAEDTERIVRQNFALTKPFVVCTGGSDSRKNLPRLLKSYAKIGSKIRQRHQLLLVGKMPENDIKALQAIARSVGLSEKEVVFAGYTTDNDLVLLLNLCRLFVFPSWHEGFGLPALEAMSCGAPVIGANTSSLPEVIGLKDALFNPFSEEDITNKIIQALESQSFRETLSSHGLKQSQLFSWDESGKRAIQAFEQIRVREKDIRISFHSSVKPKLAYISPLPPERTGIADYSSELLPALSNYYDIDVIVDQAQVSDSWINSNCPIRSSKWFERHADDYPRILYHFGNSPFHQYMFRLLERYPGVVCLHDFFMSGYSRYIELTGKNEFYWCQDLYRAHGYKAVRERFSESDTETVMYKYPCNFRILQSAKGIIVHSDYSKHLALQWYGPSCGRDWVIVPLARRLCDIVDREKYRKSLGFTKDNFVICSFGFLDSTKLNHRLLKAWLASALANNSNCYLIFVGENHGGDYGYNLINIIETSGILNRIRITGWTDNDVFRCYLKVADVAVQFRTLSRGETSAAVLDCMNHALPTIVNANGSLADLPNDAVWMLGDEFEDVELIEALETLWQDESKRHQLGCRAREIIISQHDPDICARQYSEAIEGFFRKAQVDRCHLARSIATQDSLPFDERAWFDLASCIVKNHPDPSPARSFFIDITATSQTDLKTGIERVARALLLSLIDAPPLGYRVEPVYLSDRGGYWHYRYARHYTLDLLECPTHWLDDEPIDARAGDILFGADLAGYTVVEADNSGVYKILKQIGVYICFTVFDLLPIKMPEFFPPGADKDFFIWLNSIYRIADHVICISSSVADEFRHWVDNNCLPRKIPLKINWMHLGANFEASFYNEATLIKNESLSTIFKLRPTFLMVGTIEPRKGYIQSIAAFDLLWEDGIDLNLVIVGKEGWQGLPANIRRTIPKIVNTLHDHSEFGKRLFWLDGISDVDLEKIYTTAVCLIAASEGEGFGLPLIEAARRHLPILAREISVFREVAGQYAFYFSGLEAGDLASAIAEWLILYEQERYPKSEGMPWMTWSQSVENLKTILNVS